MPSTMASWTSQYTRLRGGCHVSFEEADEIIRSIDLDGEGGVSMEEFEQWCKEQEAVFSKRYVRARNGQGGFYTLWKNMVQENLGPEDLFEQFDTNTDGVVTGEEMRRVMMFLFGQILKGQEVLAMFEVLDADGDGSISSDEWNSILTRSMQKAVQAHGTHDEIRSLKLGTKRREVVKRKPQSKTIVHIPDSDWFETKDEKTGRQYWYNPMTRQSTWKQPLVELGMDSSDAIPADSDDGQDHELKSKEPPHPEKVYAHYLRLRELMREEHWGPRDIYRRIDIDGDGNITVLELKRGLHKLVRRLSHNSLCIHSSSACVLYGIGSKLARGHEHAC